MTGIHIVPTREMKKSGVRFVLGRVRHDIKTPEKYELKVVRKGVPKVLVGRKGVYVLNDELAEKLLKEVWESYLKRYRKRGAKAKGPVVEPPIEVSEEEVREFLSREGLSPGIGVGWVNLCSEVPDFRSMAERIKGIIRKAREEVKA
jgi:hypothetical protein